MNYCMCGMCMAVGFGYAEQTHTLVLLGALLSIESHETATTSTN